jgi:hypothetical protein
MHTTYGLRSSMRIAALFAIGLALQGCLTVKSYVDPSLPVITNTQLPKVQQPRPTTVLFEFRTKGNANARATSGLSGRVIAAVAESGMFGQLSTTVGGADSAVLKVVIDNVADTGSAVAKGVGTGLTLGLAGSLVTDNYICTASYTFQGKSAETTVHHALFSTIGNHSAPPGMTPVMTHDAINQVIDQLVWHALVQLDQQNAFGKGQP